VHFISFVDIENYQYKRQQQSIQQHNKDILSPCPSCGQLLILNQNTYQPPLLFDVLTLTVAVRTLSLAASETSTSILDKNPNAPTELPRRRSTFSFLVLLTVHAKIHFSMFTQKWTLECRLLLLLSAACISFV
jgi:hypothetical protein